MNQFSFTSVWMAGCVHITYLGNKKEEGKPYDALGNVLLRLDSCGCFFNSHHLPKRGYRPYKPFHRNSTP